MEENENNTGFRSVYTNNKNQGNIFRNVFLPFFSGIVGASLVIGTCFGVPEIRTKLVGNERVVTEIKEVSSKVNATAISLQEYSDTAIGVAAKVLPSIVDIQIEYNIASFFGNSTGKGAGSGIIISEDGYILTNNHVVDTSASSGSNSYYQVSEATSVKVKLYGDETLYDATIIGTDSQTDIAVIKIDKTGLTPATIGDSDSVKIGAFAMAIGNAQGLSTSVTAGVISALNREITVDNKKYTVIQTDAAINSGISGGALVNSKGEVIGISTLKLAGTGIEGMGFAIPINSTKDIYKQLIEYKKVIRPYIGISGISVNSETAKRYNLVEGVYVQTVGDFSAAQKAGISIGDVITEIDGKKVTTMDEITEIKNTHNIGEKITIKIYRSGKYKDITLTLEEQP